MAQDTLFETPTTIKSTTTQNAFKDNLKVFYAAKDKDGKVRCSLLNRYLPSEIVIASHLWPKKRGKYFNSIFGLDNINDARNGLLLFKCFEVYFDDSRK